MSKVRAALTVVATVGLAVLVFIAKRKGLLGAGVALAATSVYIGSSTIPGGEAPITCDRNAANDAALDTQVAAATSGQTVCITAAGTYSTSGTDDNTPITITAADGVSPDLSFSLNNNDGNLTIDGRRETWDDTTGIRLFNGSMIAGTPGPDNVTIRDTLVTEDSGQLFADIFIDGPTTATILIEHNRFTGADCYGPTNNDCTEAAIRVDGDATDLTVRDNLFHDQHADGVKIGGGSYVTVINNKFLDITDTSEGDPGHDIHSDAVQINSEDAGATVRGNWVSNCAQGLTAFDKMLASTVEHNVIEGCGTHSISLQFDWHVSDARHNTIVAGNSSFDCSSGNYTKYPSEPLSATNIYNNLISPGISLGSGSTLCSPTRNDHNMCTSACGASNFTGTPTYAGGGTPSSFDEFSDFCLVDGTTGEDDADDGTQVGVCGGSYSAATYGPPTGEGY